MGAAPTGLEVVSGSILFRGEDIVRMSEAKLRKLRGNQIAMVFQEPMAALNPAVKVGEQIEEVLTLHSRLTPGERRLRVKALLSDTRLPDPDRIAQSYSHQLSGGQCQRVVIAMALAMSPALLIADEPTSALDVTTQAQVLKLMRELRDEHGHAVLFITHDFGVVAEVADRVAVMQAGRIVEIGDKRALLDAPRHPYTQKLIASVPRAEPRPASAMKPDAEPSLENLAPRQDLSHRRAKRHCAHGRLARARQRAHPRHRRRIGDPANRRSRGSRSGSLPPIEAPYASVGSISRSSAARRSPGRGARYR